MQIIYEDPAGQRLDKFLVKKNIPELYSRSFIEKLIADKLISVNGEVVKKSHQLNPGDRIDIVIPEARTLELEPQPIPLDIVFEDDHIIIVNKPAGLTVHPAPGNPDNTLVNALLYHLKGNISSGYDSLRPGIVHRLDKDTSGLIIAAKNDRVHSLLSRLFQNRDIVKNYLAITVGIPESPESSISTFVSRSRQDRTKMAVSKEGKAAVTHYRILEYFDHFSLVDIKLETGRTHQIRLHFSHINCPLLGDRTYSSLKQVKNLLPSHHHRKLKSLLNNHMTRQALHAYKLKFFHPVEKREMEFEIPLPEDMKNTLEWLKNNFPVEY